MLTWLFCCHGDRSLTGRLTVCTSGTTSRKSRSVQHQATEKERNSMCHENFCLFVRVCLFVCFSDAVEAACDQAGADAGALAVTAALQARQGRHECRPHHPPQEEGEHQERGQLETLLLQVSPQPCPLVTPPSHTHSTYYGHVGSWRIIPLPLSFGTTRYVCVVA